MSTDTCDKPKLMPKRDPELRASLLDYFVSNDTGEGISNWLSDLGQDTEGKVAEKRVFSAG